MDFPQKAQEKVKELENLEQNLSSLRIKRQQLATQQVELQSAIAELESTKTAYKIVGNIMIHSSKDKLLKELEEKRKIVDLHIITLEKQEQKTRDKVKKTQEEVMKFMPKDA